MSEEEHEFITHEPQQPEVAMFRRVFTPKWRKHRQAPENPELHAARLKRQEQREAVEELEMSLVRKGIKAASLRALAARARLDLRAIDERRRAERGQEG